MLTDRATNVLNKEEDWEAIVTFCDKVNKDLEGPQTAVRLLVHKIQSPQEKESLLALTVSITLLSVLFFSQYYNAFCLMPRISCWHWCTKAS
jgi:VHS domain